MARISIRLRLTLWYAGVLLFGLGGFGATLWLAARYRLLAAVDARLAQQVQGVATVVRLEHLASERAKVQEELSEFSETLPDGALMQIRELSGAPILSGRGLSDETPGFRTEHGRAGAIRVLVQDVAQGDLKLRVLAAASLAEYHATLANLRDLLLTLSPLVLLVACCGGYWISRRALAPVDRITEVARSISVNSLGQRLAVPNTGDEVQRLSETWNDVLERLDTAVQNIRQFTADASHELRTPLSLIHTTAEIALRKEREPERYRQALNDVLRESARMASMTESLLALARGDASDSLMVMEEVDLAVLAQGVVEQNAPVAEARGIRLLARGLDHGGRVQGNDAALRRLLLILIDNALKYTQSGGSVTVTVKDHSVEVNDTGIGISPQDLPHIFERFYRADKSRTGNNGVGLGLSIARMIAASHGAEIHVDSSPGRGSSFRLTLPAPSGEV